MAISIIPLSKMHYPVFYKLVQSTRWGNPMLPACYSSSLWGMLLFETPESEPLKNTVAPRLIGGWVGTLRGNVPLLRLLAKSVYFDSYPVFTTPEAETNYLPELMSAVRHYARRTGVILLNLTHWVRGNALPIDMPVLEATFCTALHTTSDHLWKQVESKQRNCIRKAEKSGVVVEIYKGEAALPYLNEFQRLRQATQQHAIQNHNQASMLLKSDTFFADKFCDPKATLFVGKVENSIAAVALMLHSGDTVYYYSGGSNYDLNRRYCCSALLIWRAITYYNDLGVACFDMGGVPVSPSKYHPAYGVYAFKRSFGGIYQEYKGGVIPISPVRYRLLRFLLSQRKLLRLFSNKL